MTLKINFKNHENSGMWNKENIKTCDSIPENQYIYIITEGLIDTLNKGILKRTKPSIIQRLDLSLKTVC